VNIPLVNLKRQFKTLKTEISPAIEQVISEASFVRGPNVARFEEEFSTFTGAAGCVGVANGTDAIILALEALNVQPGDEVIVPASTFIATAEAVSKVGAKVIFADVDPVTNCLSAETIEKAYTPATKGIIVVHLYGYPAPMPELINWAKERDLWIVEDCAQAHAAKIDGQHVGTFGDIATFSFYPGKNLGAYGDAGAVISKDLQLLDHVRRNANHGRSGKYSHEFVGQNSRMDGIQGAVLSIKLQYLQEWTNKRRTHAQFYAAALAQLKEHGVILPTDVEGHVYHLFVLRTAKRDALLNFLKEKGIQAGVHYPIPIHLLEAYKEMGHGKGSFAIAEQLSEKCISLPICPELTQEEAEYVAASVIEFFEA